MLDLLLAIGHHLLIFAIFGIICVGFWLVLPGWGYSSQNAFFWAKIATFAAIGLLSLPQPWPSCGGARHRCSRKTLTFSVFADMCTPSWLCSCFY